MGTSLRLSSCPSSETVKFKMRLFAPPWMLKESSASATLYSVFSAEKAHEEHGSSKTWFLGSTLTNGLMEVLWPGPGAMPGGSKKALAPSAQQVATTPTERLNMVCACQRYVVFSVSVLLWSRCCRSRGM